jgi:hypothetical protein
MKEIIEATILIASLFVVTNISEMLTWSYELSGVFEALALGSVVVMSIIGGAIILIVAMIMIIFVLTQIKVL